jgi:tight adherence protein B
MIMYLFIFSAVVLLVIFISEVVVPYLVGRYNKLQDKRATEITVTLEDSFIFWEKKKMLLFYLFPFIFSAAGLILFRHIIGLFVGFIIGFIMPKIIIMVAKRQRLKKFGSQLVDSLMIISSSLKAGLSFPQSIEVLCEEMPPPISQEFNLILNESKLGVSMEVALKKLRARIPTEEVNLIVTSILIAREAGGNLPLVLSRLTNTIRDNLKLKEKIGTLTLQGRMQGIIMVLLPIGFAYFVYKQNPGHFDVMLQTDLGRKLLGLAVGLQIIGVIMIRKISIMRF